MQHGMKCKKDHKVSYIKDIQTAADNGYKIKYKNGVYVVCSSNSVWLLNLTQMVWSKQPTSEPKPLPRYSHSQVCTVHLTH